MAEAAALQQMRDGLPEEERKGNVGKIISYIVDLCQGGWSIRAALTSVGNVSELGQQINTIEAMLEHITEDGKEAILEALVFQKQNATEELMDHLWNSFGCSLTDFYDGVAQDKITDHEKTKQKILRSMRDFQKKESNKLISDMVYGSAFIAAIQFVKIYKAWKTLSQASNLIQANPNEFKAINSKLQRMEQMVTELLDLCESDPKNRKIPLKMQKINTQFNTTLSKISDLRIKINGQIQCVDLTADYAAIDGFANLATAGTQAFQLWHTWEKLTSFTRGLALVSVGVFVGLAVANAKTYVVSQETLQNLRRDLNEAVRLKNQLDDLFAQAEHAIDEIEETS